MNNATVYLGVWTNWSNGGLMGATLTTTRKLGDLLIAFTAFLIPYVASRFWRIFCLIVHRYYSTADHRDAVHHQRQIILRNSSSPEVGLVSLFNIFFAWWTSQQPTGKTHKRLSRLLPTALFAICCISAFTVAGGLSAQISTARGDVVLLKGSQCGIGSPPNDTSSQSDYYSTMSESLKDAANYAHGYLDSNNDLGMNTPASERLRMRYVLQCSPLVTEGFTSEFVTPEDNMTWVRYNYGEWAAVDANNDTVANYTFDVPNLDAQYAFLHNAPQFRAGGNYGLNYRLSATTSKTVAGSAVAALSDFMPIPQLFRPDGDVSIMLLSGNGVLFYGQEMDDDWYRGTVPGTVMSSAENASTMMMEGYLPQEAGSPLGCLTIERWQWCNGDKCGPLASAWDSFAGAAPLFNMTAEDFDPNAIDRPLSNSTIGTLLTWSFLTQVEAFPDVSSIVRELRAESLASQSLLQDAFQLPIPLNQWQLDVTNWFNIVLAVWQSTFVTTAVGNSDPVLEQSQFTPQNAAERKYCNSQKIRSTTYASFSLFGLLFTYIITILIILTSFILEPIFSLLQRRRKYEEYARLEWVTNETLQLHRLTQEELNLGTWHGCTDLVPTTEVGEVMAGLDIADLEHPVLRRPGEEGEKKKREGGEIEHVNSGSDQGLVQHNTESTTVGSDQVSLVSDEGEDEMRILPMRVNGQDENFAPDKKRVDVAEVEVDDRSE
ncbi:uncharacterized protein LY89DRAFT_719925 [Mollisia scopiformis]|uniref:Uncharacterized protein n=1 Tax=Mollisia scopiformis TaxID=149040 RepID=A0A194X5K2_MOLSC|nr:uncharacterized protein LY89DRAFT_719925 [Mollisia scopiformis]KUJ15359.1 hypothetical protein LY89DRAFT_719925 [Mollisia scopiformis]